MITDGWQGYRGLDKLGYVHDRRSQRAARARGEDAGELLPAVHGSPRWPNARSGHPPSSADDAHLPDYLNKFVFRFNRRRSRSRGLLFYRVIEFAVGHDPVRYRTSSSTRRRRGRHRFRRASGTSTDLGAPASEPSVENPLTSNWSQLVRLDGYPQSCLIKNVARWRILDLRLNLRVLENPLH